MIVPALYVLCFKAQELPTQQNTDRGTPGSPEHPEEGQWPRPSREDPYAVLTRPVFLSAFLCLLSHFLCFILPSSRPLYKHAFMSLFFAILIRLFILLLDHSLFFKLFDIIITTFLPSFKSSHTSLLTNSFKSMSPFYINYY